MYNLRSLVLTALLVPSFALASDDIYDAAIVFERGLSVGVDAVEREYRVQGWKKEEVETLGFMVILDSKNISTKRLLLLKDFGFRRGLAPVELSNGTLLYKSFDNAPDAYELTKYLNDAELKDIKEKVYVYKKRSGERFTKAPFAFKYIFDQMQKEIKDDVQVVVLNPDQAKKMGVYKEEKVYVTQPPKDQESSKPDESLKLKDTAPVQNVPALKKDEPVVEKPKPVEPQPKKVVTKPEAKKTLVKAPAISVKPTKAFRLKSGNAEMFVCSLSNGSSDDLSGKSFTDGMFKPYDVVKNKGQIYKSSGVVVTNSGVRYVKVAGRNMYFDAFNTSLGN